MEMWEILVPTIKRKTGKPIKTKFHKRWDDKVREISGGLTILAPVKGQWISLENELFNDRMIPVRIIVKSKEDIEKIVEITLKHYEELAVLCYKVSEEVILKYSSVA